MTITANFASGILFIAGDTTDNSIVASRDVAGNILVNGGAVPITGGAATVGNTSMIQVGGSDGNDFIAVDETNGAMPATGFLGGRGDDTEIGGSGNDVFVWNPGDGNDTIEGQGGLDTLNFIGSNVSEQIDISANGGRVRFSRDVGNITMDVNNVETINFAALGGIDRINVNDLTGTHVGKVAVDLAASGGGGDGAADTVIVNGTAGNDQISLAQGGSTLFVNGLAAQVTVDGAEAANDVVQVNGLGGSDTVTLDGSDAAAVFSIAANGTFVRVSRVDAPGFNFDVTADSLVINGNGGDDTITAGNGLAALTSLTIDGGAGNDTITGGDGDDRLLGGTGNDIVFGGRGNDVALLGDGDDTFVWNPGDGSDTIEGQAGLDTLMFNGANINEKIDISANGGRARFTRDVAAITMDLNGVETIAFKALGGADTITVNDLSGTDVTKVAVDLQAGVGGGDGAADTVIVNATAGNDLVSVGQNGAQTVVSGLAARVTVDGQEVANDSIQINGLGGNDVVVFNDADTAGAFSITANGSFVRLSRVDAPTFTVDVNAEALVVNGGGGDDIISAGNGLASLTSLNIDGGAGNDTITGGDGADFILGGTGNDTVFGGRGNDFAMLGDGDDTFVWNPGDGSDTVEGQAGLDTLMFNGANINERIDISANGGRARFTRDVAAITMDVNGVETIAFKALGGADTITVNDLTGTDVRKVALDLQAGVGGGDGATDTVIVNATAGNDQISLAQGGSTLFVNGLAAQVTVDGAEAANDVVQVNGLGGFDTVTLDGSDAATTVSIAANGTFVHVSRVDAPGFNFDVSAESLVINGNGGDDTIAAGNGLAPLTSLKIDGGAGNDTITGGDGADVIIGGTGNDYLIGGDGNDTLIDGSGLNTLQGGKGDDIYAVQSNADTVFEFANEGTDQVQTFLASYTLSPNVENLTFVGSATHTGIGNELNNVLIGGTGNDYLIGLDGNDTLIDGSGLNTLQGGKGDDIYAVQSNADTVFEFANEGTDQVQTFLSSYTLSPNVENLTFINSNDHTGIGNDLANVIIGNGGNDFLNGLAGNDTLTGGAGADMFVFTTAIAGGNNIDTITDFTVNVDRMLLDHQIFTAAGATGVLAAAAFTSGAETAASRIVYDPNSGALSYDADGSGAAAAVQFATLSAHLNLTSNDFLIV